MGVFGPRRAGRRAGVGHQQGGVERQQRRKGALRSALDEIPGIGESYQKRLLNHFGSVKAMREASVEDFEKVKGIGHAKAEALYNALHEQ